MDQRKISKQIEELLADPWQINLQELIDTASYEEDEIKRNLFEALYTYVLQKRQVDIINRDDFII